MLSNLSALFCVIFLCLMGYTYSCQFIVDTCGEECHDKCKDNCYKNFGVCAVIDNISYCFCFDTRPKREWFKEWQKMKNMEEIESENIDL